MFGVVFIFLANYDPKEWSHRYGEQVSLFVQGLNTDCVLEKVELMTQQFKVLGWEVAVFDSLARISPGGWVSIRLWIVPFDSEVPLNSSKKTQFCHCLLARVWTKLPGRRLAHDPKVLVAYRPRALMLQLVKPLLKGTANAPMDSTIAKFVCSLKSKSVVLTGRYW